MTKLTEDQIRTIARVAKDELGESATLEKLRDVVQQVVDRMEDVPIAISKPSGNVLAICMSPDSLKNSQALSEALKDTGCKVAERSEQILGAFHVLLALIDNRSCTAGFDGLKKRLSESGTRHRVRILLQTEEGLEGRPNEI